jgi:hypothetical protein
MKNFEIAGEFTPPYNDEEILTAMLGGKYSD